MPAKSPAAFTANVAATDAASRRSRLPPRFPALMLPASRGEYGTKTAFQNPGRVLSCDVLSAWLFSMAL